MPLQVVSTQIYGIKNAARHMPGGVPG